MCHFLQCPSSHKHCNIAGCRMFIIFDTELKPLLLLILSFLGKTTTIIAFIMTKHCSNLALLHIANQYLFLQHHSAFYFIVSGGQMDRLCHLPPQIHMESYSSKNLCHVFYFRLIYGILRLLGKSKMDSGWSSPFRGNNRQHMPVYAKMISSLVRKDLSIAKTCISPCTF